jgi:hypothetical protein
LPGVTLFSSFALSFGSLLVLQAVIAAWLFRTASAPLWAKIAVPSLVVALGCYAPFAVASMMGFPVFASMAELPDHAELIAFVPLDGDKRVDLWLRSGDAPRAYETVLDPSMRKVLQEAREKMEHGQAAMLAKTKRAAKGAKPGASDPLGIGDDPTIYELDPSAMSGLPPKE